MERRDWTLAAFTLLMQSSIGTLLVIFMVSLSTPGTVSRLADATVPIAVAASAGALALVVSLLHLGHPAQARLALMNVRTSWLSREIAASMLFVGSTGVLALVRRTDAAAAISVLAIVAGVVALYAMCRLYMVPAQPAWRRAVTPLAFICATLLLGSATIATIAGLEPSVVRNLAVNAVALLVLQTVLTGAFVAGLVREPAAAVSAAASGSTAVWLTAARLATAVAAILLLLRAAALPAVISPLAAIGTVAMVLLSELAGRMLFYGGRASIAAF